MKDISGVAGWWWETTLREAKVYYDNWKVSTPLQRIQIEPKLPDALKEHNFQRIEQRGIQMLLKAIPAAEQQALCHGQGIVHCPPQQFCINCLSAFRLGGPGEKQQLPACQLPKQSMTLLHRFKIGDGALDVIKRFKLYFQMGFCC